MLSMTGFGAASASAGVCTATVQVSSVNNRGLQIQLRGDLRDLALEDALRRIVRERLARGTVTLQIAVAGPAAAIDRAKLAAAWREIAGLAAELGAPAPTIDGVARMVAGGDAAAPAGQHEAVLAAAGEAIAAVVAARRREGDATLAAFRGHAAALRALHARLRDAAALRLPRVREQLQARLREALGQVPIDESALARELALQADRLDVSEELVRLGSHLDALDALLASADEAQGRQLEFLLQELGREINTTGSKANDVALTRLVLEAKNVLEQMREQAANIA